MLVECLGHSWAKIINPTVFPHNNSFSQAARTVAGSLFAENVDVEDIIIKFNGKVICSDYDWEGLVRCFKAEREVDEKLNAAIRVFSLEVEQRE